MERLKDLQTKKKNITQKELKKVLKYFPKTGEWMWRKILSNRSAKGKFIGCLNKYNGYIYIRIYGKLYLSQRLAFLYMNGFFPENDVDHINRIKNDNSWINLREVTRSCNMINCGLRKNNKSNVTGVSKHKNNKGWVVRITINKKQKYIGYYKYKKDAVKARWKTEIKYNFHNCTTTSSAYLWLKERNLI